jgi:multiple sugar transport system permease protein
LEYCAALWARWPEFFVTLGNSLIVTALATTLAVAASLCSGYAYSRFRGRWIEASALFLIAVRLIPPEVRPTSS